MQRDVPAPRRRLIWFVLWCLGWAAVAALSLMPPATVPNIGSDKLAHMLAYAWMAATAVTFCRCPARLALVAVATMLAGGAMELAQGLVPHRQMDVADAVANGIGAMLGYLVALAALLVLRRSPSGASPVRAGARRRTPGAGAVVSPTTR